jgi:hypothetical protein
LADRLGVFSSTTQLMSGSSPVLHLHDKPAPQVQLS